MNNQWKALFVGDIVLPDIPSGLFLSRDFAALMKEHDIRCCNFEAPVEGAGKKINKAGPHLQQHKHAPAFVEAAGFNIINLANNHMYDYGQQGMEETLSSFKHSVTLGAGIDFEDANTLKQLRVNDVSVGFLSYCEAEFGVLTSNNINRGGYAWINHPDVNNRIREARKQVDTLIVQVHAGVEDIDLPLPEWRARYKELIDCGADAVIAHHPHVPQGWEVHNDKPIFYSLGNFYFDKAGSGPYWNKGIAVSLSFNNRLLTSFDVIPIEKTVTGIIISTEPSFITHLQQLNEDLGEPGYSTKINDLVQRLWQERYHGYYAEAIHGLTPSTSFYKMAVLLLKRLFFKKRLSVNTDLLLHNIRIESHRWVVERYLNQQDNL